MDYRLLGEKIRKERLNKGFTQEVLAEKANVSVSFMGQIERGERKLSLETLVKVGTVLDLDFDYLLASNRKVKQPRGLSEPVYIIKDNGRRLQESSRENSAALEELIYLIKDRTLQEIKMLIDVTKAILKHCKAR